MNDRSLALGNYYFLYGLVISTLILCEHYSFSHIIPNHIASPSRHQTKVAKVLKNIVNSTQREASNAVRSRSKTQSERDPNFKPLALSIKQSGAPIIQLFVRRMGAGHWTMFSEKLVSEDILEVAKLFCDGGINTERVRSSIECSLALDVFGKGLGDPPMIEEVKKVLPHFGKLKSRLFQFGFKLFSYEDVGPVYELARNMTKLPIPYESILLSDREPASVINVESIVREAQSVSNNLKVSAINELIANNILPFINFLRESNASEIFVSADGSASMNGRRCVEASTGAVFFIPTSSPTSEQAEDRLENLQRTNEEKSDNSVTIASPAKQFTSSNNFILRVKDAGGVVLTPFDAELLACLSAITLAKTVEDALLAQCNEAHVGVRPLRFILSTDSRSLCRAVRNGKPPVVDLDPDVQGELLQSRDNRIHLWNIFLQHIHHTKLTGTYVLINHCKCAMYIPLCCFISVRQMDNEYQANPTESEYYLEWSAGHPERREADSKK